MAKSNFKKTLTQIVTKLKNPNCEKTHKLKFWHNSNYYKTQNSNCDKTHKLNLWQNSNYDTTQNGSNGDSSDSNS